MEKGINKYYVIGKYCVEEPVDFNTIVCVTLHKVFCFDIKGTVASGCNTYIHFKKVAKKLPTEMLISLGYREDGKWGDTRSPFCYVHPDKRKNPPSVDAQTFISKIKLLNQDVFSLTPYDSSCSSLDDQQKKGEKKRTTKQPTEDSEEEVSSPGRGSKKQKPNTIENEHHAQPSSSAHGDTTESASPTAPDIDVFLGTAVPAAEDVESIVHQILSLSLRYSPQNPLQYYMEFVQKIILYPVQNNQ